MKKGGISLVMSENMEFAKKISIREAGKDEYWLQDLIFENPNCLCLGELDVIERERRQSSGGRLDILLKNPEDDTMYEVEIMLGETDETHIIRTIEYWDNESRRWPQRQHFAVLVAEHINRRFFNVIQLLSHSIPIIAIQASLLEVHGKRALFFSKILDTYEEVDDGTTDNTIFTREDWVNKSKCTLETAEYLCKMFSTVFSEPILNFVKAYIAITQDGSNCFSLRKRSQNKSLLGFRLKEVFHNRVIEILDNNNISYTIIKNKFSIIIDKNIIDQNRDVLLAIAEIVKENKN